MKYKISKTQTKNVKITLYVSFCVCNMCFLFLVFNFLFIYPLIKQSL